MYCYELIFAVEKKGKITNHHESIVTHDEGLQALEYAMDRLRTFPDDELVAVVRREPIVKIVDVRQEN